MNYHYGALHFTLVSLLVKQILLLSTSYSMWSYLLWGHQSMSIEGYHLESFHWFIVCCVLLYSRSLAIYAVSAMGSLSWASSSIRHWVALPMSSMSSNSSLPQLFPSHRSHTVYNGRHQKKLRDGFNMFKQSWLRPGRLFWIHACPVLWTL